MGAENLAANETRYPNRPARSESLYRLSYPGPEPRSQFTPMIINNKSVSVLLHVQKIHRLIKKVIINYRVSEELCLPLGGTR